MCEAIEIRVRYVYFVQPFGTPTWGHAMPGHLNKFITYLLKSVRVIRRYSSVLELFLCVDY